ncbi:MAG: PspC domain-containing protein, partial [Woeseiaceae bacterium]|nr:PspC domain-containing protein [Woeseiaceae bacterium]
MSRDTWNIHYGPLRGFYRDRENGWIFGVCAGIADRFNFHVGTVRVIALISLLLFFWLAVALYLGATMLIKEKPLVYSGRHSENDFWYR